MCIVRLTVAGGIHLFKVAEEGTQVWTSAGRGWLAFRRDVVFHWGEVSILSRRFRIGDLLAFVTGHDDRE